MRRRDTPLRGVEIDMVDISDLVPTARRRRHAGGHADPISGVGFIRDKESDRLGDLAAELRQDRRDRQRRTRRTAHRAHRPAPRRTAGHAPRPSARDGLRAARPRRRRHRDRRAGRRVEELAELLGRAGGDPVAVAVTGVDDRLRVAAFDVDGTLTRRDCVVPFLRRVAGTPALLGRRSSPRRARCRHGVPRRDRDASEGGSAAGRVHRSADRAHRGSSREEFARSGARRAGCAPTTVELLRRPSRAPVTPWCWCRRRSRSTCARSPSCSASTTCWPPGSRWVADGRLTGRLDGPNCRGPEKVRRLHAWLDVHAGGRCRGAT